MIDKKVCYKIDKYDYNQDGIVIDKVRIEDSDFYLIQNLEEIAVDTVRCDKILYIKTGRY